MSIKKKLSVVLLLVLLILVFNASLLINSLFDTQKQVKRLNDSTIELKNLVNINLNIGLQAIEIMDYFLGENEAQVEFEESREELQTAFRTILSTEKKGGGAAVRPDHVESLGVVKNQYNDFLKRTEPIWSLDRIENPDLVYDLIHNQLKIQTHQDLIKRIDEHIDFEFRETETGYDALLMNLGRFPWSTKESTLPIRASRLAYQYFLSVGKTFTVLNELVYHMSHFILFQDEMSVKAVNRLSIQVIDRLEQIKKIIHLQMGHGVEGEEEDLVRLDKLMLKIDSIIADAAVIISLVNQGKIKEAFILKEQEFHEKYEEEIKEPLLDFIEDGQVEVTEQNNLTLEVIASATRNGVLFLILLSVLIFHITYKMFSGMMDSVSEIKKGIEAFAKGTLNYRIKAYGDDELVAVSNSFNDMALNLHESHLALESSKLHTDKILYSMNDTLFVMSAENIITSVNNALCRLLEYKEEELIGHPVSKLFCDSAFNVDRILALSKDDLINNLEVVYKVKSDKTLHILFSGSIVRDNAGAIESVICAGQDITQRKEVERQLEHDVIHDALTGLSNRVLFMDRLKQALKNTKRDKGFLFAVLIMDLDRFKIVNDSLGHLAGDELLTLVPERINKIIRPDDTFARMGGDEFALLLDGITDTRDATRVAERILQTFKKPFLIGSKEINTSISIGIAQSATGYEQPEDVLRDADTAMYEAKGMGRSRYKMFDTNMHLKAVRVLEVESAIRTQLKDLDKEFLVYYQPIVSLVDARIIGAEALIRWQRPTIGLVSPLDFIPIAEETGIIVPMGEWVLRKACQQIKTWHDLIGHSDITVSVNFSARQFQQQNLPNVVQGIINETRITPEALDIEITESIAMKDIDLTMKTLDQFYGMGLKVSLDDFGTGYSSMAYLKRFCIDTLKIDKTFIDDISDNSGDAEIAKAIVALAHSLNMKVIAEGIEDERQLAFLRAIKCDKGQGYYFSKPVPESQFLELLQSQCFLTDRAASDMK